MIARETPPRLDTSWPYPGPAPPYSFDFRCTGWFYDTLNPLQIEGTPMYHFTGVGQRGH
jgi:hypothetical protein